MSRLGLAVTKQSQIDRVWDVIDKVGVCMMSTRFSGGLRARPLEARADKEEGLIWFDRRGVKDDEIEAFPEICLTFIYPRDKAYLSISGSASVSRDTERAKDLWNEEQQAWWPGGPSDPNVLVIRFKPEMAEIWDGPASSAVASFDLLKPEPLAESRISGRNAKAR